jgi:AraC-like DNA-binding protein
VITHSTLPSAPWHGQSVTVRRRVDWPVILGADTAVPSLVDTRPEPELVALLRAIDELPFYDDANGALRRAVELATGQIGLARAGLFLLDQTRHLMLGTWGTDLAGHIIGEHHVMYEFSEYDREVFRRAASHEAVFTVLDNCPIVVQRPSETWVAGRGWVACTPIRSARANIGMLFNDAGLSGAAVDRRKQGLAALLCSRLGSFLDLVPIELNDELRGAERFGKDPLVERITRMLKADPSLAGKELAIRLNVSQGRLAHVFKVRTGMSLVDYRNQLRVRLFQYLIDRDGGKLRDAALSAGFGSYAQFHRVFSALRGATPRAYKHATSGTGREH